MTYPAKRSGMKIKFLFLAFICAAALSVQAFPEAEFLKIFNIACRERSNGGNIMISPWGITQCYGMISCGAGESNAAELQHVLGLDKKFSDTVAALSLALKNDNGADIDFNSFNAILFDRKYVVNKNFAGFVSKLYNGKVYHLDYSRKEECVSSLNRIVEQESYGKFTDVFSVDDFAADPEVVLMNVLYFNADWQKGFEMSKTQKEYFFAASGDSFPVKMMNDDRHIPYYNDGKIHGIILNYRGECFKLLLMMPLNAKDDLSVVSGKLAECGIGHFVKKSSSAKKTSIKIPKLKLESNCNLTVLLKKAGLKLIFDPATADLQMVGNHPLFIAQSMQLLKLELNETGTDMVAVTYAIAKRAAFIPEESFNTFHADHPFVAILFDSKTNVVLLTAAIKNVK